MPSYGRLYCLRQPALLYRAVAAICTALRPFAIEGIRPMRYPFVPISQRQPLRWPNGKRLAVMITINLEYWDVTKDTTKLFYPGGPGIVGGDLPGNVYDNPN